MTLVEQIIIEIKRREEEKKRALFGKMKATV